MDTTLALPPETSANAEPNPLNTTFNVALDQLVISEDTTLPYNRDFMRDALKHFIKSNFSSGLLLKDFLTEHCIITKGTGTSIISSLTTSGCLQGPVRPFGISIGFIPTYTFLTECTKSSALAGRFRISQADCKKALEHYDGSSDFFELNHIQKLAELFRNQPINYKITSQEVAKQFQISREDAATLILSMSERELLVHLDSELPETDPNPENPPEFMKEEESPVTQIENPNTLVSAMRTNELQRHVKDIALREALTNPIITNPTNLIVSPKKLPGDNVSRSTKKDATPRLKSEKIQALLIEIIKQSERPISAGDILEKLPPDTLSSAQMVKYHLKPMIRDQIIRSELSTSGHKTELFSIF